MDFKMWFWAIAHRNLFLNFFASKKKKNRCQVGGKIHHFTTDLCSPELVCASVKRLGSLFFAVLFSLPSSLFFPLSLHITTVPPPKTTLLVSYTHMPNTQLTRQRVFCSVLVLCVTVTSDHFNNTFTHFALIPATWVCVCVCMSMCVWLWWTVGMVK